MAADRETNIRQNYEITFSTTQGKAVLADLIRYGRFVDPDACKLLNYIQWQLHRRFDEPEEGN